MPSSDNSANNATGPLAVIRDLVDKNIDELRAEASPFSILVDERDWQGPVSVVHRDWGAGRRRHVAH